MKAPKKTHSEKGVKQKVKGHGTFQSGGKKVPEHQTNMAGSKKHK